MTTTWPSSAQRRVLSKATVKLDYPSESAYLDGAKELGLDVNLLKAFAKVESGPLGGFLDTGEPVILFERHLFHKLTKGRFSKYATDNQALGLIKSVSSISDPKPGGYGPISIQHRKLTYACTLDREAALCSASWGLYQILGMNYLRAGFYLVQSFINAMYRSADDHLLALVAFIQTDQRLHTALKDKNFLTTARLYNGPRQRGYDKKFELAYRELTDATV
jgi:type VI secretion system secreted protein VgrG